MKCNPFFLLPFWLMIYIGAGFLGLPGLWAQAPPVLSLNPEQRPDLDLRPSLRVWADSTGMVSWESALIQAQAGLSVADLPPTLNPDWAYWGYISLQHLGQDPSDWVFVEFDNGQVDLYLHTEAGTHGPLFGGKHYAADRKQIDRGHLPAFEFRLLPAQQAALLYRIREIDHSSPAFQPQLFRKADWYTQETDRRAATVLFFCGIFGVMILYNLMLFATTRVQAYFWYAAYLFCVTGFVQFSVGAWQTPPWGNPRWILPLGYLFFGAINLFYFQFGRSFLKLRELLPNWDRLLHRYIQFKILLLVGVQALLFVNFHIPLAEGIEFFFLLVEVVLSLLLITALYRKASILARYFIAGSISVIVFGLSLAVLGHLLELSYTYELFLTSIVAEILFFSLGLGYRIRASEREQLAAQEALNTELSKINTAYGRFVPHEFLESLGHKSILDVNLGDGVERSVTVLFSDIRAYTSLSERMSPRDNFDFLNRYLGQMGPAIQQHRGFVNQYYGDGIMALFMQSPLDALEAGITMFQNLDAFNEARLKQNAAPIRMGIGLHQGPLMMGVIGDTLRMEAGVVSDTVNTASRMEGLTKHFGVRILLTEETRANISQKERFHWRYLGNVRVKGRDKPVGIYECFNGDPAPEVAIKLDTASAFAAAISDFYQQDFKGAIAQLKALQQRLPLDKAVQLYLARAQQNLQQGVSSDWDGIDLVGEK